VNRVVVDANVLIDAVRRDRKAIEFLRVVVDDGEVWSVTPVRTEVLWNLRPKEVPAMRRLFASIYWLDVSESIADRAGSFGQRYGRSHGLDAVDAIVAAAAEAIDGQVATLNVRDFPMFPGLKRPY
jgi:predicted nucleic acid-binding protein